MSNVPGSMIEQWKDNSVHSFDTSVRTLAIHLAGYIVGWYNRFLVNGERFKLWSRGTGILAYLLGSCAYPQDLLRDKKSPPLCTSPDYLPLGQVKAPS